MGTAGTVVGVSVKASVLLAIFQPRRDSPRFFLFLLRFPRGGDDPAGFPKEMDGDTAFQCNLISRSICPSFISVTKQALALLPPPLLPFPGRARG